MNRREFLAAAAILPALRSEPSARPMLLLSEDDSRAITASIQRNPAALRRLADAALTRGPWNITGHRPKGIEVPPHEYYSEGPYWWPDPKNPSGPYIRRDGERNPDRFDDNHRDIGAMSTSVLALGMGAYFLNDDRYAAHARKILNAWFLDPETRMNPNLEFGQAVRGINNGRGTGIIDTVSFIYAVQGIMLLDRSAKLDAATATGLRSWFADYLRWMTTSEKGLDEKKSGNNHATWWTAQVAAYAGFTGDQAARKMAWIIIATRCSSRSAPTAVARAKRHAPARSAIQSSTSTPSPSSAARPSSMAWIYGAASSAPSTTSRLTSSTRTLGRSRKSTASIPRASSTRPSPA